MFVVFGRRFRRHALVAWAILAAMPGAALAQESLSVSIDRAEVLRLPQQVATIVIGNPLVADAALQRGGVLVVTGKGYGQTNLVALDREGKVVVEKIVQVVGAEKDRVVFVWRGIERESYSCTPNCERRVMLGDSAGYFGPVLAQTAARSSSAQAK